MWVSELRWMMAMVLMGLMAGVSQGEGRMDVTINEDWVFYRADVAGGELAGLNQSDWEVIDLPHTWNAVDGSDGGNNYYRGIGWYRKFVTLPQEWTGRRIYIYLEGAGKAADVYVNEVLVGHHDGAYASFCFDITEQAHAGAGNLIAVKVSNASSLDIAPLSGDFTQWGGLCRSVRLVATDTVHVTLLDYASPGVYLTQSKVSEASADVEIKSKIRNAGGSERTVLIRSRVLDREQQVIQTEKASQVVAGGATVNFVQDVTLANPRLWNAWMDPYFYTVVVEVLLDNQVVDRVEQPLGLRYYHVDPDGGLYLNGSYLDLHGVAIHEDREGKGRAISDADRQQDLEIMREMGCTWLRLAHYQHAEKIYDLADAMGFVVWTEIPFVNSMSSTTFFRENLKDQLRELIRQNYNHPSVMFWGLFNEIATGTQYDTLVGELNALAHSEDSTRPTTAATNRGTSTVFNWIPDLISWNMYWGWYSNEATEIGGWADSIHAGRPGDEIGMSEYGAGASILHHQDDPPKPANTATGWHPEEYQNYFHETYWQALRVRPFIWNKTIWNGYDFGVDSRNEGDRPGINDKGMVIRDRTVRKDAFYWYQANWTTVPMVYISSRRFTPRPASPVAVKVYSNCDEVELVVNGKSKGLRTSSNGRFDWSGVALLPGANEIIAVGRKGDMMVQDSCEWELDYDPIAKVEAVMASDYENIPPDRVNPPSYAVDNNLSTRWAVEDADNQQDEWITLDLGRSRVVDRLKMAFYRGAARVYTFNVLASDDNATWTTVLAGVQSSGTTEGYEYFDIPRTSARYFRIHSLGNTVNNWTSYYEVALLSKLTCAEVVQYGWTLAGDVSGPEGAPDCYVDLYDLKVMVDYWLDCNDPQDDNCAMNWPANRN